ncbi:MAG: Stk1 family PASTA domain-containing Ser/Thr kinase [Clostridia bacterium]|nr:Stk1 family PASTA domain-containing Ser/Thr kinase [Clostridia bacterium]
MDKFVGKRLDGRYEIREIIGVGGMAVVYKAYDCIEDRIVAVKILKEEFISNEEFIIRFKNESKAIAVLNHPNIVKVYDVSFGDVIQYIVMEYVDGVTLKQYIEKQKSLRWKDAVYLTIQVLRALQHAHDKGIVHRDVKPQNIMLLSDGTIKVTDFGIARFARSEHKTMTDKAIGSVHYISPEQARGEATDEKADIYSVGVMLYEMLTGRLPFEADSAVSVAIMQLQQDPILPRDINENIPVGLEQITMHAMQKEVSKRYRSAAEMLRDLEEFRRSPDMVFEYTYFVDNEPTRFVDAVSETEIADSISQTGAHKLDPEDFDDDEYDEEDEKSPVIPILAGVAIAFIIAAIVIGIVLFNQLNKDTSESVIVPNFVGMTVQQIEDQYPDFNFKPEYRESADIPAGTVIAQDKGEGRTIKKTQTITLTISSGTELIEIPRLYNLSETEAQLQLKIKGFLCTFIKKHDATVPKDHVISTNPGEGQMAKYGTVIDVYISMGPEVKYVDNIDCRGYSLDDATRKLEAAGLKVGNVIYEDGGKQKDVVLSQTPDPAANFSIPEGTQIDLVVSTGKTSYSYTLKVDDLPKNFKENYTVTLEAQIGGQIKDSVKIKINDYDGSWQVEVKGVTDKKATVYINITSDGDLKLDKALVYTIDMVDKTDTVVVSNKLNDYIGSDTSSSTPSVDSSVTQGSETSSATNPVDSSSSSGANVSE